MHSVLSLRAEGGKWQQKDVLIYPLPLPGTWVNLCRKYPVVQSTLKQGVMALGTVRYPQRSLTPNFSPHYRPQYAAGFGKNGYAFYHCTWQAEKR